MYVHMFELRNVEDYMKLMMSLNQLQLGEKFHPRTELFLFLYFPRKFFPPYSGFTKTSFLFLFFAIQTKKISNSNETEAPKNLLISENKFNENLVWSIDVQEVFY